MLALLHNIAVFQHQDHIRVADGGQAVDDDKGRASRQQLVERFLDETLGARFIKDEDTRVCERGAPSCAPRS